MSLTALAVISRQGTPLYLHDYASNNDSQYLLKFDGDDIDFDDVLFGGEDDDYNNNTSTEHGEGMAKTITSAKQRQEWPCRIKYQFVMHSACERLHEILEENMWKTPSSGGAMGIMDACWVGFLCSSDRLRAYGYVTTNTRYIALVEDSVENVQILKSRDSELCGLMSNVHRMYTESLLNPFTPIDSSKITSKRFETRVLGLVQQYNGRST